MEPNPDFIASTESLFGSTDTLLVTCRSGGRSAIAVNMLAKAGFVNAYNIIDGMGRGQGKRSRKRLPWKADEERLEELRSALDLRCNPELIWGSTGK